MALDLSKSRLLLGGKFEQLGQKRILIAGAGGVGGFALMALYKAGAKNIDVIDYDVFEPSNQNRQLGSEFVGRKKVEILAQKFEGVRGLDLKLSAQTISALDLARYDIIIDAIDDIPAKVALALRCASRLISSLGSAKRLDPLQIKTGAIWDAPGDGFTRRIKRALKDAGFSGSYPVVYSTEPPACKELGSFVGVTGAFGFALASLAIKQLCD